MTIAMRRACIALVIAIGIATVARSEQSNDELAKETQNPIADLISVPFQNNFNFNTGPDDRTVWIMNIQPVVPIPLSSHWNLITRTIMPIINQPSLAPGIDHAFGLGDINPTLFLSPVGSKEFIWGAGPTFTFPTATRRELGSGKWSAGPAAVALTMQGPWVAGILVNNQWSFAGWGDHDVNELLMQPFVNYNFGEGWYAVTAPPPDGRLDGGEGQPVDGAARARRREAVPAARPGRGQPRRPRQAADQHAATGILQRRAARLRAGLAASLSGAVPLPTIGLDALATGHRSPSEI